MPKVHVIHEGRPLCGGGNGAKTARAWQEDIGPVNCGKCLVISSRRSKRSLTTDGTDNTDGRGVKA